MKTAPPEGTQALIVEHLKRHGASSIPDLARTFGLSVETVRSHVKSLSGRALVTEAGARRQGPGRPEGLYDLTDSAQALFPSREGEILRGLARFLTEEGQEDLLKRYLERFARERRDRGLARMEGLRGEARLEEAARILTEEGYMAEVVPGDADALPRLRLCHCPVRELVDVSKTPCKAEIGLVRALVGDKLARVEYLPDGDGACAYAIGSGRSR